MHVVDELNVVDLGRMQILAPQLGAPHRQYGVTWLSDGNEVEEDVRCGTRVTGVAWKE